MNKITLIGNLTKAPEITQTTNGKNVCKFTLAVSRQFDRDTTDYFNIIVWGKLGENCAKFVKKGSKVAICGELQMRQYEKEGIKRMAVEVVASDVEFLTTKSKDGSSSKPIEDEIPF